MANVTGTRWLVRILLVLLVATPMALICLHLGPDFGFDKMPKVLCALTLNDGSRLVLIQKRNDSLLDAYSSLLYRCYPDSRVEVTELGFEDSFWWLATLRTATNAKSIEIRACGTIEGIYDPASKVASWPSQKFPPAEASLVAPGDPIRRKLAFTNAR